MLVVAPVSGPNSLSHSLGEQITMSRFLTLDSFSSPLAFRFLLAEPVGPVLAGGRSAPGSGLTCALALAGALSAGGWDVVLGPPSRLSAWG